MVKRVRGGTGRLIHDRSYGYGAIFGMVVEDTYLPSGL